MNLRRRMRRIEREAKEVLATHGCGDETLRRKATSFMVAVDLRLDYEGRLADPAPREARYRERLAEYGLEFEEEHDRPYVDSLAREVIWLGRGRRAAEPRPRRGQSEEGRGRRGRLRGSRFL